MNEVAGMELFHGSHEQISEVRDDGVFGGIFGSTEGDARAHADVQHVLRPASPLTDFELNYSIEGAYGVALEIAGDETAAAAIMSAGCETDDPDPETGWELQRLRGELAVYLGYDAVEMADEHGTTWLCLPGCPIDVVG